MKPIKIVHIYPVEMNIYGDNGNVLVLKKRLEWRGIPTDVIKCGIGDKLPSDTHLIIGGGGQDAGQSLVADDLKTKARQIHKLSDNAAPMLMICGMYQMFGHYFKTQDGTRIPGISVLDIHTEAQDGRIIGNVEANTKWGEIIGYENHSGRTFLGKDASNFGVTKMGQGNNGSDKTEGAMQNNVFGSYLHGPMLAKSPVFADYLLSLAIKCSGQKANLNQIDDSLELLAAAVAVKRPR